MTWQPRDEMKEVYHNQHGIAVVDEECVRFLKERAQKSPLRRSRFCLHRSADDQVHEMIIVMCKEVLFPPHRHLAKTESFHMIEGFLDLVLFDDDGAAERTIYMGPLGNGATFCYRLCAPQFHAILPRSEFVVMHETTTGPFIQGDAEFAPWAPIEPVALRAFLEDGVARARASERACRVSLRAAQGL